MATPGEQQQQAAAAEEVVSVEMPAPDGWTKKVRGDDDLLPACLPLFSLARSTDLRSALLRFLFNFGDPGMEFDFPGREI
jgi:hypothetical protein